MVYRLKTLIIFCFLLFACLFARGQELNCDVEVSYENIKQTDPSVFRTLEDKIFQFLNETVWTDDEFKEEERIDCSFYLNITNEVALNEFQATATITSTRPVYNSTYNTVLLDVIDKDFEFTFDPYTVLEYRENDFANNLTSSLAFYAYTIIGLDYDSFITRGGREFHEKARQIVQTAGSSPYPGWTQSSTNNSGNISKYWINNNLIESKYNLFRTNFYNYHRNGLDHLYDDPRKSWEVIASVLKSLERFHQQNRNMPLMYVFFEAKAEEIVNIMSEAPNSQKQQVAEACLTIDPLNNKLYKSLQN